MLIGRSGGPLGNAYIDILEPQIDSNGQTYLPIYYHFPVGTGDSIRENSALVKPFSRVLNEGKPVGKTAFAFYRENNICFVLGSFASIKRTIFFPGVTISRVIHRPDGTELTNEKLHNIDHFTLEEDFINWHVTLAQKKNENIK